MLLLVAAGLASTVLILSLGAGLTFLGDEWDLLLHRRGLSANAFLAPLNEHLLLFPTVMFKALQAAFGMESTSPFRALPAAVLLACAVLLFVYLRRCVGDWLALLGVMVVLFLGAAWEVLLWPINIGFSGSMTAGLGMLLALEREDRRGDLLACLLLAVSIAFTSLGLVFAAGAAAEVWLREDRRLARSYVVAVPVLLFALWYLGWGHTADSALSFGNALTAPSFVVEGIGSSVAAVLGLFAVKGEISQSLRLAGALLVVGVALSVVWSARNRRGRGARMHRPSRWFWVVAVIGLVFWLTVALSEIPGRTPSASRYMYPGAIFLLLLVAEWFRGVSVGSRTAVALGVLAGVSIVGNIDALFDGRHFLKRESDFARAELGAVEITRDSVDPDYKPASSPIGSEHLVAVDAGSYLSAIDAFGSPGDDPTQLIERSESVRRAADVVLAQALGSGTIDGAVPARAPSWRGEPSDSCATFEDGEVSPPDVQVGPTGVAVRPAPGATSAVRLRRFATESYPVELENLPGGKWTMLHLPRDGAEDVRWRVAVDATGPVAVCTLGRSPGAAQARANG